MSINKQAKDLKIASAFYLGFARERDMKTRFLISSVSAGNITLCRS